MGTKVVHPVIVTADIERAVRFYCDAVGLVDSFPARHDREKIAQLSGMADPDAIFVILAAPGGGEIELVQFIEPCPEIGYRHSWADPGIRSVTFAVDDLDATLARVREFNECVIGQVVRFDSPVGELDVVYVAGPDGILLTLCAPAPETVER